MSQITRCPSCATTFKVVADQLRISEGWVRCGQCKEVFDAASHLLVTEQGPLLPDMTFEPAATSRWTATDKKAPEPVRVWGSARHTTQPAAPVAPAQAPQAPYVPHAAMSDQLASSVLAPPAASRSPSVALPDGAPRPGFVRPDAQVASAQAIPAFLHAGAAAQAEQQAPNWGLEPTSPYGWRTRERAAPDQSPPAPAAAAPVPTDGSVPAPESATAGLTPQAFLQATADGYELPMPQLRGSEWPDDDDADALGDDLEAALSDRATAASSGRGAGLDSVVDATVEPGRTALGVRVGHGRDDAAQATDIAVDHGADEHAGKAEPMSAAAQAAGRAIPAATPLSPHHRIAHPARHSGDDEEEGDFDDDEDLTGASPEPGFVRSARRKAFWTRPAVRTAMAAFALLLALILVAQMAVRERDLWAARHPQLKPLLAALCVPWQCQVGVPRQIADVVIDSSSFTKSRTDTYQLSLTLKSKADVPVAMPALELTLTDAQDQPVLRKVLLASDIAAPDAIASGGSWSGALTLSLSGGANRVAGYRLLAFYP